jgi:hypothetical protein
VLQFHFNWKKLSAAAGITFRNFYFRLYETRQRSALVRAPQSIFGEVTDNIRRAARIAGPRIPSPEAIREACQYGLEQLMM